MTKLNAAKANYTKGEKEESVQEIHSLMELFTARRQQTSQPFFSYVYTLKKSKVVRHIFCISKITPWGIYQPSFHFLSPDWVYNRNYHPVHF